MIVFRSIQKQEKAMRPDKSFSIGEILSVAARCKLSETDPGFLLEQLTANAKFTDYSLGNADLWESAQIELSRQLPWTRHIRFKAVPDSAGRAESEALADAFVAAQQKQHGAEFTIKAGPAAPDRRTLDGQRAIAGMSRRL
jgi:hypothetical protein